MSIVRTTERPEGFVVIDQRSLKDPRLSWAARGLLAYLLALPDGWTVRPDHLAKQAPDSDYRLRQALAELQACGYARIQRHRRDDGKMAGSTWIIFEQPQAVDNSAGGAMSGRRKAPWGVKRARPSSRLSQPLISVTSSRSMRGAQYQR